MLQLGIEAGAIAPLPVHALAVIVGGALDEAALHVAEAADPAAARAETLAVLDRLLDGLRAPPSAPKPAARCRRTPR